MHVHSITRTGSRVGRVLLLLVLLGVLRDSSLRANDVAELDPILDVLLQRVAERPDDGSSWRLLGRAQLDCGQLSSFATLRCPMWS